MSCGKIRRQRNVDEMSWLWLPAFCHDTRAQPRPALGGVEMDSTGAGLPGLCARTNNNGPPETLGVSPFDAGTREDGTDLDRDAARGEEAEHPANGATRLQQVPNEQETPHRTIAEMMQEAQRRTAEDEAEDEAEQSTVAGHDVEIVKVCRFLPTACP